MVGTARLASALILLAVLVFSGMPAGSAGAASSGTAAGGKAASGRASAEAGDVAQIDEGAFQRMLEEVSGKEGSVRTEDGDTLRVELAEESTVMFFTTPFHPAHPGIVSVKVMREEGVPHVLTDGWRAGDRQAFDNWFTAFVRRNAALVRRWQEAR